jgi:RNA polymerase sigma-70 factor (ECF subfamily)
MIAPCDAASPRCDAYGAAAAIEKSREQPECFGVVFEAYFAEIHAYAGRRLGVDAADDIAAETFLTAFRKRDHFDAARGSVRAWLYGIATNHMGRHRRAEVRRYRALARGEAEPFVASHEDRVAAWVSAAGFRGPLAAALASLPSGDRDVLLLVALGELTYDEVAVVLDIPYGTVCSRLNRARRKVREALGGVDPLFEQKGPGNG